MFAKGGNKMNNLEDLLDRIIKQQGRIVNAIVIINKQFDEQVKINKQIFKAFEAIEKNV